MPTAETTVEVNVRHKCGHSVTYHLPEPRPVQYRSDAQMAVHSCEDCKALEVVPKGIVYRDDNDGFVIAFVEDSYWSRGRLSKQGYEFIKNFRPDHPKAWVKRVARADIRAEIAWARSKNWEVNTWALPYELTLANS